MPRVNSKDYYPYEEAVKVVAELDIKSFKEWCDYITPYLKKVTYIDEEGRERIDKEKSIFKPKEDQKDPRLPSDPRTFYSVHGKKWKGWGHFLGTGNISPSSAKFLSYEETERQVKMMRIRSKEEYRIAVNRMNAKQWPKYPENYYPKQGIKFSWKDFLAPKFDSFEEVRSFVRSLPDINTYQDWIEYVQSGHKPPTIPSAPREVYRDEWVSWPDFLGSGNKPKPKPLKEERSLKIVK
jgi:hypothetical protein